MSAVTIFKNLTLNNTNGNQVNGDAIQASTTIPNTVTHAGSVTQSGSASNSLKTTSFQSSAAITFAGSNTMNATNLTVSNLALTAASGNTIDSGMLPTTLTNDINSTNVTAVNLSFGNSTDGSKTRIDSRNTPTASAHKSNVTADFLTITVDKDTSESWVYEVMLTGVAEGADQGVVSEFVFTKSKFSANVLTFTKAAWLSNSSEVNPATVAYNSTSGVLTFSQTAGSTDNGNLLWNLFTRFTCIKTDAADVDYPSYAWI